LFILGIVIKLISLSKCNLEISGLHNYKRVSPFMLPLLRIIPLWLLFMFSSFGMFKWMHDPLFGIWLYQLQINFGNVVTKRSKIILIVYVCWCLASFWNLYDRMGLYWIANWEIIYLHQALFNIYSGYSLLWGNVLLDHPLCRGFSYNVPQLYVICIYINV
jgi:hypothetical protein